MNKIIVMFAVCTLLLAAGVSAVNYGWGGFYCTSSSQCQEGTACAPADLTNDPDTFVCQYPSLTTWQTAQNLHGTNNQNAGNGSIIKSNGVFFYNETSLTGTFTTSPILADLDNDGKPDLITTNANTVSVYTMDGNSWDLIDSQTINGTIQYAPYVGNLSFYSRSKSSKQQEIMVVAGWNAYVMDFANNDLRIVEYANISDVGLPSALLNISSNIDCFSVNTTYTTCAWKASNQIGTSGYIITVFPSSNSQYPTNTRFKDTQQSFYVTDQQFNGTTTRRGVNELIYTNTTSSMPTVYFRSDNYSAIYAYDSLIGALDTNWGNNGILTYTFFTYNGGTTNHLYETHQLFALDSRNSGNIDICAQSWTAKNYNAGVNWDSYNNITCYTNTASPQWTYIIHADGNKPQSQLWSYGVSVADHSSFTYPLVCQMYVPDGYATTSDRIGFRCDAYAGSNGYANTVFDNIGPADIAQNCVDGTISNLYLCKSNIVTSGAFISNESRSVFGYKNIYFIPNGSGGNYSKYENLFTTDDGSQSLLPADVLGNKKVDVIRWNSSVIYTDIGGSTPAENINYTPLYVNPLVQNGTWYGYYTTTCTNTVATFRGNECDVDTNEQCAYYNEPLHQERLGTTCDGTQPLTWGSWSPDSPSVSCTFNSTGTKTVRVYLADDRNPTDTSVYDTVTDINILVADTECNLPEDLVNRNQTSIINPENPIQPDNSGGSGGGSSSSCNEGFWECIGMNSPLVKLGMAFGLIFIIDVAFAIIVAVSGGQVTFGGIIGISVFGLLFSIGIGLIEWWVVAVFVILTLCLIVIGKMFGHSSGNA